MLLLIGNRHAERVWNCGQCSWQAREAVSSSDLRNDSVATEQQVGKSSSAGCRPYFENRHRYENVSRGMLEKKETISILTVLKPQLKHSYLVKHLECPLLIFN